MALTVLDTPALALAGGAIYPYSEALLESLAREGKYDDGEYNLGRVIGKGAAKRIQLPRHMAPAAKIDQRAGGNAYEFTSAFVPRNDEQSRIVAETVHLLEEGHNFMVEAPTGFGKTACTMDIIAKIGRKTLVIVTKDDVRTQWAKEARAILGLGYGKGLGLIQGDKIIHEGCGLVLASVQSIAKEARYDPAVFADFGLVIVDECHRIAADFFSQAMYRSPAFMRFGLSATPDRSDGKEEVLLAHLGPVMVNTKMATLVPKVVYRKSPWKIPMVSRYNKRKGRSEVVPLPHNAGKCMHVVKMLTLDGGRNAELVKFIHAAFVKGRHILVMSDLRDHLLKLKYLLKQHPEIREEHMGLYVGGMKEHERDAAKLKPIILCTYMMTKEATDIPRADTLVMATPKSDVRQIVGRVTRIASAGMEKAESRVFDLVDEESVVFRGYWRKRLQWYVEQGIEIVNPTGH